MAHIKRLLQISKSESQFDKTLERELGLYVLDLANILNRGLKFSDNFDLNVVTVSDTGSANTLFTVAHSLKRVPIGFLVVNINKSGNVYDEGTSWTATNIYLKCSAANANLKLFIF